MTNKNAEIRIIPILMSLIIATLTVTAFTTFLGEGAQQQNKTVDNKALETIEQQRNITASNVNQTRQKITNIDANSNIIGQIIDIASLIFGGAWTALLTLLSSFKQIFIIIGVGITELPLGTFNNALITSLTTIAVLALLAVLFRASLKTNI